MSNSRPKRRNKRSTKYDDDYVSTSIAGKNNKKSNNNGDEDIRENDAGKMGSVDKGKNDEKCCSDSDVNKLGKDTDGDECFVTEESEAGKDVGANSVGIQKKGINNEGTTNDEIGTTSDKPGNSVDVVNEVTGCKSPDTSSSMLNNINSSSGTGNNNATSPNKPKNASYADKLNNNMDASINKLFQIPTVLNEDGHEIGTPLIMDAMTTKMCTQGVGRLGYARVLVEADANKGLNDTIEVLYKSKDDGQQFVKKVQVVYDCKPPVCSHCKVFGHSYEACLKREKTMEKTTGTQADEEGFVQANKRKDNHGNGSRQVPQQARSTVHKEKPKGPPKPVETMQAVKLTANKYAILGDREEDNNELMPLSDQEKETVDKYVSNKSKPPETVIGKWKQNMFSYFTKSWDAKYGKDQNDNNDVLNGKEVFAETSELAKFMTANEVSGKGSDCLSNA
ncbi:hypothetical protein CTI12_AA532870 [Artemisia annua]|uniref:Zinc knuckle CX2CX4HX4C n=1 Tax=Artemisia annua TaxID=35608 RepID=A0A2U1L4G5_ARTAN|nr:hypothetical protein CTI12_AA532870 [Artemisia annua]